MFLIEEIYSRRIAHSTHIFLWFLNKEIYSRWKAHRRHIFIKFLNKEIYSILQAYIYFKGLLISKYILDGKLIERHMFLRFRKFLNKEIYSI